MSLVKVLKSVFPVRENAFWNLPVLSLDLSIHGFAVILQVEKQRADLARELDELTDRLEEAGGITATQVNHIWHHQKSG